MEHTRRTDEPPGYRFKPTARELIHYYLNPWVTGTAVQTPFGEPQGVVCAADVYSADPGTLTSRLRHFGHDDGNWYFLCVARWKDGNVGTRMHRAVQGGGTWHGSGKRIAVRRHGYRQTFEYRDAGSGKSAWLMEEFGSSLAEATDGEGVKVLCRVHRTPRAVADEDEEERQETDELRFPSSKRLRQEDGFAPAYGTAPAPPDVGCSYASTSQTAQVNGTASTTWQQQLMMKQGVGYYCSGVNGTVDVKDEPEPLEILPADIGWQQFAEMGYGFGNAAEDAQMNEWMRSTFSCPKPSDGAQEGR